MMETWGAPSIFLHSEAYEYAEILTKKGKEVVDLALAGGFAREDHTFRALALGAPYSKLICIRPVCWPADTAVLNRREKRRPHDAG